MFSPRSKMPQSSPAFPLRVLGCLLVVSACIRTNNTYSTAIDIICPLLVTTNQHVKMNSVNKSVTPATYGKSRIIMTDTANVNFMDVTIDSINGNIYTGLYPGAILIRAAFDGSSKEILFQRGTIFSPQTAVIPEEDQLFFLQHKDRTVEVAHLNGTGRRLLIQHRTATDLRNVVVDPVARFIFHTSAAPSVIYKSKLDGSDVEEIVNTNLSKIFGLALDYFNKRLYWADNGRNLIESADCDGRNRRIVFTTLRPPRHIDVYVDSMHASVFWTEQTKRTMWGIVGWKAEDVVSFGNDNEGRKNGIAVFREDCQTSDVAEQCAPRVTSNELKMTRKQIEALFEVKTCSRIKIQLRNAHIHMVYEVDIASSQNQSNSIWIVATKKIVKTTSALVPNCTLTRQFWVKWANNIISSGVGHRPGMKTIVRVKDNVKRYGKIVSLVNLLTYPKDENAVFTFYPVSSQLVFDPPVSLEKAVQLNDNNNATCLVLAHIDMYTFSAAAKRWSLRQQGKCIDQPGLTITKCIPDAINASFSVVITGRHLVCSNSVLEVSIKQKQWPQCETAGIYRKCEQSGTTASGVSGLTTCVAKCVCEVDNCKHVTINIPNPQTFWEVCEIGIK